MVERMEWNIGQSRRKCSSVWGGVGLEFRRMKAKKTLWSLCVAVVSTPDYEYAGPGSTPVWAFSTQPTQRFIHPLRVG